MLILVCIVVGLVIVIAICVTLIIIKLKRRNLTPPSAMLLDADHRKSIPEPFPPMVHDSGHYRSLVKTTDKSRNPTQHCSSRATSSQFQTSDNRGSHPPEATRSSVRLVEPYFSTIRPDEQTTLASREEGAPDYFVLDRQFC